MNYADALRDAASWLWARATVEERERCLTVADCTLSIGNPTRASWTKQSFEFAKGVLLGEADRGRMFDAFVAVGIEPGNAVYMVATFEIVYPRMIKEVAAAMIEQRLAMEAGVGDG